MASNSGGGVDASAALFSGGNGGTPLSFFRSNPNGIFLHNVAASYPFYFMLMLKYRFKEVKELKRNLIPFPRVGKRQSLIPFPRVGRSGPPADTSEIYDEVQGYLIQLFLNRILINLTCANFNFKQLKIV